MAKDQLRNSRHDFEALTTSGAADAGAADGIPVFASHARPWLAEGSAPSGSRTHAGRVLGPLLCHGPWQSAVMCCSWSRGRPDSMALRHDVRRSIISVGQNVGVILLAAQRSGMQLLGRGVG
jgi:hypothetical protein